MYEALEKELLHSFKDKELLRLALCHKSHANEDRKKSTTPEDFVLLHNERLEFLGDAVLGLVISDLLSEKFPHADEGKLSRMRSSLVKAETLASVARTIQLGEYILLGKGESSTKGRDKDSILSSTYEALLGAIYLDAGLPGVFDTVKHHFARLLDRVGAHSLNHDTKTQLQEISQALFRKSPAYKVVSEEGPDHEKTFEVMVTVGGLSRYGKGRNKKEAEAAAARFLLEHLQSGKGEEAHA